VLLSTVDIYRSYIGLPSVLWHCWLGGRKGIQPVKNWVVGAGVVVCLERGTDLHMAQLMPLPLTVSCFSKIQVGFTFLVPAHLGIPGKWPWNGCCCCCCYTGLFCIWEKSNNLLIFLKTMRSRVMPLLLRCSSLSIGRGSQWFNTGWGLSSA